MKQDERTPFARRCSGHVCRRTRPASSWARRASCGPARSCRWRGGPASGRGSPCWTCAAAWRGRDATSPRSWAAPTSAWTRARARSSWPGAGPTGFRAASRWRGCLRCRRGRSTSSCCWRPCSRSRTRSRCCGSLRGPARGWPLRPHRGGGRTAHRGGAGADARRRHRVAGAARGAALLPRAGRPPGALAAGVHELPPGDGRGAARGVPRRAGSITEGLPSQAFEELVAAHRLWSDWLTEGRVRKFALVAEKPGPAASSSPFVPLRPGQRPWR